MTFYGSSANSLGTSLVIILPCFCEPPHLAKETFKSGCAAGGCDASGCVAGGCVSGGCVAGGCVAGGCSAGGCVAGGN